MGKDGAMLNELTQLPFDISWHVGITDNAHGELLAAMGLLNHDPPLDFLIGCTSDQVSVRAASTAATKGVIQIAPYTFTSRLQRDTSSYVFRTSVTSRDYAEAVIAMMR